MAPLPSRRDLEQKFARDLDALETVVSRAVYAHAITDRQHVSLIATILETRTPGLAAHTGTLLARGNFDALEQITKSAIAELREADPDLFAPSLTTRELAYELLCASNNEVPPEVGSDRHGFLWGVVDRSNAWELWRLAYKARRELRLLPSGAIPKTHVRGKRVSPNESAGRIAGCPQ